MANCFCSARFQVHLYPLTVGVSFSPRPQRSPPRTWTNEITKLVSRRGHGDKARGSSVCCSNFLCSFLKGAVEKKIAPTATVAVGAIFFSPPPCFSRFLRHRAGFSRPVCLVALIVKSSWGHVVLVVLGYEFLIKSFSFEVRRLEKFVRRAADDRFGVGWARVKLIPKTIGNRKRGCA